MGGYNIGELTGALRLDDSEFLAALERSKQEANLFKVNVVAIGDSVRELGRQLSNAGFNLKEVQGWLNSLRRQGLETSDAVQILAGNIGKLQERLANLHSQQTALMPRAAATDGMTQEQAAERVRVLALANRAKVEERLDADARKRQQEMQERFLGDVQGKIRAEESYGRIRTGIEQDALRRQKEMQAQVLGDAQAKERIAKESAAAEEARQRAMYTEFYRQRHLAGAATQTGFVVGAVGAAGVGAGVLLAKDAADFQDAMVKSLAVVGPVSDQMRDRMAGAAREIAKATGLAAKEVAEDYAVMAKGGFDVATSLQAIPLMAKFAIATNSELHESTRQVITIMEALQLSVTALPKVLNELTTANQIARGSVDQLATTLEGRSGAALRSAGVSLEQALALTVAFSKAGVTASQSQTFLAQIIERLTTAGRKYGDEIVDVNGKQMKFHDIVYLANGQVRPFIDTLKLLDSAFQGHSANAIGNFFDDIHLGSTRGSQAIKILLNQADSLGELSDKFGKVGASMDTAFNQQMQSPLRQLDVLKAKLKDIAITLGIPIVAAAESISKALAPVLTLIQHLAEEFSKLPQSVQTSIAVLLTVGSVSLVAGGGLLVMAGQVALLAVNLKILLATGQLTTLVTGLSGVAAVSSAVAIALVGVAAGIASIRNMIHDLKSQSTDVGFGLLGEFIANVRNPFRGSSSSGAPDKSVKIDSKQDFVKDSLDDFRKKMDELKRGMSEIFNSADFAFDPKKIEQKLLQTESFQTSARKFQDEFNRVVDNLTEEEESAIQTGIGRLNRLVAKGADTKVLQSALTALRAQLAEYAQFDTARIKSAEATQRITDATIDAETKKQHDLIALRIEGLNRSKAATEADINARQELEIRAAVEERGVTVDGLTQKLAAIKLFGTKQQAEQIRIGSEITSAESTLQKKVIDIIAKYSADRVRLKEEEARGEETSEAAAREHETRLLEIRRKANESSFKFGDISGATMLQREKDVDAQEEALQRASIKRQFDILNANADGDSRYFEKYADLKRQEQALDDARAARMEKYSEQERAGLDAVSQAIQQQITERQKLMQMGDISGKMMDLAQEKLLTNATKIANEGLGGVGVAAIDGTTRAFSGLGQAILQAAMNGQKFGDTMQRVLKAIPETILGEVMGSLEKLAASKLFLALIDFTQSKTSKSHLDTMDKSPLPMSGADIVAKIYGIDRSKGAAGAAGKVDQQAQTQATINSTIADNVNTTAVNANTAALQAVTAALVALLSLMRAQVAASAAGAGAGILGTILKIAAIAAPAAASGAAVLDTGLAHVHSGEVILNQGHQAALLSTVMGNSSGGRGMFDFRGASFHGVTQGDVDKFMTVSVRKLRNKGWRG